MSAAKKPLVIDAGQVQQLQSGNDLDIPLADRVFDLERKLQLMAEFLIGIGLELPEEFLT